MLVYVTVGRNLMSSPQYYSPFSFAISKIIYLNIYIRTQNKTHTSGGFNRYMRISVCVISWLYVSAFP